MSLATLTRKFRKVRLWQRDHERTVGKKRKTRKTSKACLLSLPLEIRRIIYRYALLAPEDYQPYDEYWNAKVQLSWSWPWVPFMPPRLRLYEPEYWGKEPMSTLFRLNRQLHLDTEEFFYGSGEFVFEWPRYACACCVPEFLGRRSLRAREIMSTVYLHLVQGTNIYGKANFREQQNFFQAILAGLPSLRHVTICVRFFGGDVNLGKKAMATSSIVKLAGIFRDIQTLELTHDSSGSDGIVLEQRVQIVEEARDSISRMAWEDLEQLPSAYSCCSEQKRAWVTRHIQ